MRSRKLRRGVERSEAASDGRRPFTDGGEGVSSFAYGGGDGDGGLLGPLSAPETDDIASLAMAAAGIKGVVMVGDMICQPYGLGPSM